MSEKWRIYNFVVGDEYEPHQLVNLNEPPEAWVEGWLSCMVDGYKRNPYAEGSTDWSDYEAGWDEADRN
jgi:hypothetical protein